MKPIDLKNGFVFEVIGKDDAMPDDVRKKLETRLRKLGGGMRPTPYTCAIVLYYDSMDQRCGRLYEHLKNDLKFNEENSFWLGDTNVEDHKMGYFLPEDVVITAMRDRNMCGDFEEKMRDQIFQMRRAGRASPQGR